jgi:Tol biopolymer transport system component
MPLDSCTRIIESRISSAGNLEVIYADANESTRLWNADLQAVVSNPAPSEGFGLKMSSDHRQFIFRREGGEIHELWVIDADGQHEKRIATVRYDETAARYAADLAQSNGFLSYDYSWVPNTDKIFYDVFVAYDIGVAYDQAVLVDVNSGSSISITLPPNVIKFEFAPDGSQMAIETESELRALSTYDGGLQFTVQAPLNDPTYSPDGKYIIDFIDDGILRIGASDGQQQIIPLKYSIFVPPGGDGPFRPSPKFKWVGSSILLVPSLDSDQRYVVRTFEAEPNSWTFKVWKISLTDGTTHSSQTFIGDPSSVVISPENNRLAFRNAEAGDVPGDLFLADLNTGEILETIEDGQFEAWHPDSHQYIYSTGHPKSKGEVDNAQYFLGQIGANPTLLDGRVSDTIAWLDAEWIVADCQIIHITP